MKHIKQDCALFTMGGIGYALIEILWRRKTHWTMMILGGTCFVSLYKFYKRHKKMKLPLKCIMGSSIITFAEFLCGCIVNIKCKLNVWDYSKCKLNVKGQICIFYSTLWALLCIPISKLCTLICKRSGR